ncbi:MAG: hypothetical protein WCL11_05990 [Verrucomicrobiota bacterium]
MNSTTAEAGHAPATAGLEFDGIAAGPVPAPTAIASSAESPGCPTGKALPSSRPAIGMFFASSASPPFSADGEPLGWD